MEAEKIGDKDGKELCKLMNIVVYGKTMKSLRNGIDLRLVGNKKDYLKRKLKLSYMSHKLFHNV